MVFSGSAVTGSALGVAWRDDGNNDGNGATGAGADSSGAAATMRGAWGAGLLESATVVERTGWGRGDGSSGLSISIAVVVDMLVEGVVVVVMLLEDVGSSMMGVVCGDVSEE